MKVEAEAEVVLEAGAEATASSPSTYSFIVTFGKESFSAAVIPGGSAALKQGVASRVRLRFLAEPVAAFLKPDAAFTFQEPPKRFGRGRILEANAL